MRNGTKKNKNFCSEITYAVVYNVRIAFLKNKTNCLFFYGYSAL